MCPPDPEVESPAPPPPEGDAIISLQVDLDRLGFDPGKIDGRFGPKTRAAIRRFERSQDVLEPSGEPTPEIMAALAATRAGSQVKRLHEAAQAAERVARHKRDLATQLRAETPSGSRPFGHPHEEAAAAALGAAEHFVQAAEFWQRAATQPEDWKLRARAAEARKQAALAASSASAGFVEVAGGYGESGDPLTQARALEGAAKASALIARLSPGPST